MYNDGHESKTKFGEKVRHSKIKKNTKVRRLERKTIATKTRLVPDFPRNRFEMYKRSPRLKNTRKQETVDVH